MLVVLRVKEIPPDSSGGIFYAYVLMILMLPVHPIRFFLCGKCLYNSDKEYHAHVPGKISQAEAQVAGNINTVPGKIGNDVAYQDSDTANDTRHKNYFREDTHNG